MNTTRRDALRKVGLAGSLIAIPGLAGALVDRAEAGVCAAPATDDTELTRLGEEFDRLYVEWLPLEAEHRRCSKVFEDVWEPGRSEFSIETYGAMCDAAGVTAAEDAEAPILDRLDELAEVIFALPAHTAHGVSVKLRVVRFCVFGAKQADREFEGLDWDLRCFVLVQREFEVLAAGGAL